MKFHEASPNYDRFDGAIRALCPVIEYRVRDKAPCLWSEYDLRKELVGCILGSQVRYEMAFASTQNLEQSGMLNDCWWSGPRNERFSELIFDVLSGRRNDLPSPGRHRFSKSRSAQLTRARDALAQRPLVLRLANDGTAGELRRMLVEEIPGMGPKQASMFLRNIGRSYDLAILDTHVLRFLDMRGLVRLDRTRISTIVQYEKVESLVVDYASSLGYPIGYLDWAIWATMKAGRELGL